MRPSEHVSHSASKVLDERIERTERSERLEDFAKRLCEDGRTRGVLEGRNVEVVFDEGMGSVECSIGGTRCVPFHFARVYPKS